MKKNIVKIIFLGLVVLLNLGCSQEKYHKEIILEKDGEVYSAYLEDINYSIKNEYPISDIFYNLSGIYKYTDTNIDVKNDIYNFIVIVPIKTRTDLEMVFSRAGTSGWMYMHNYGGQFSYIDSYIDETGYYHYKLYRASNAMASAYLLNDIKDKEIYIKHLESSFAKDIKITSNKLTIPAEEFEHMLERLGISHDRLSFQPEGIDDKYTQDYTFRFDTYTKKGKDKMLMDAHHGDFEYMLWKMEHGKGARPNNNFGIMETLYPCRFNCDDYYDNLWKSKESHYEYRSHGNMTYKIGIW